MKSEKEIRKMMDHFITAAKREHKAGYSSLRDAEIGKAKLMGFVLDLDIKPSIDSCEFLITPLNSMKVKK